jgi:ATP-dependent Clp protease protease subunit
MNSMSRSSRKHDPLSRIITLGEINNESACTFLKMLSEIQREDQNKEADKREPIKLMINSMGGAVYEGMGIIDAIETSVTPVHVYVYGMAMSMAFAIAASGHYRYASPRSTFMYHELLWDTSYEKMKYHEQEMKENKRLWKVYDDVILNKTSIPLKTLQKVCERQEDWYMTAQEALKLGVIDEILE